MGDGPRYGIMDYRDKVFFVSYITQAKPKERMLYATIRQQFKDKLTGINHDLQCTDAGDLTLEEFDGKIQQVTVGNKTYLALSIYHLISTLKILLAASLNG